MKLSISSFVEGYLQKVKKSKKVKVEKKKILKYSFTHTRRFANVSTKEGEAISTLLCLIVSSTMTANFPFQKTFFRNDDKKY